MSNARIIVLSITHQGLTKREAAAKYGVTLRWVNILLARFREGDLEALQPGSRKPHTNPRRINQELRARIIELRAELTREGFDAGPISLGFALRVEGVSPPATSTIRRVLVEEELITPQPRKRPRRSLVRFQANQPNETWQSDFTHWRLADGSDVEILNWLDDHSRFLLGCTVFTPVTGPAVVTDFLRLVQTYGPPHSTLTDNGVVYTARFQKGRNQFEYELVKLGIVQKNGSPGHPQTQGKIERFHQTLKRYLVQHPRAHTPEELQQQLDIFRTKYNTRRPHKALSGATPAHAYQATIKAKPGHDTGFDPKRIRFDKVDESGKVTLRRAGKMHRLGIGRAHARQRVIILTTAESVTVTHRTTGEILSEHSINPEKRYWPKK
jgi:transposase InsO family protein